MRKPRWDQLQWQTILWVAIASYGLHLLDLNIGYHAKIETKDAFYSGTLYGFPIGYRMEGSGPRIKSRPSLREADGSVAGSGFI